MPKPKTTLQSRTQSRARRLGLDVKKTYTRGQARRLRERLSIKLGGPPGQRTTPSPSSDTALQKRTASRAKRLGLAPKKGGYTRGQARTIREDLSIKYGGPPGQRGKNYRRNN